MFAQRLNMYGALAHAEDGHDCSGLDLMNPWLRNLIVRQFDVDLRSTGVAAGAGGALAILGDGADCVETAAGRMVVLVEGAGGMEGTERDLEGRTDLAVGYLNARGPDREVTGKGSGEDILKDGLIIRHGKHPRCAP